jgi:hypothetical protein
VRDGKTKRGVHLDGDAPTAGGDALNRPRLDRPADKRPRGAGTQVASDYEHLIMPVRDMNEGLAVDGHGRADGAETNRPRLVDELRRDPRIAGL